MSVLELLQSAAVLGLVVHAVAVELHRRREARIFGERMLIEDRLHR